MLCLKSINHVTPSAFVPTNEKLKMSECHLAQCQYDRKVIRREFNKLTKNLLLQIGLETISKEHFHYDTNLLNENPDEQSPVDFNPNQACLFCLNREEYFIDKKSHHNSDLTNHNEENSPLDLTTKSQPNLNRSLLFNESDSFTMYNNQDESFLSSHMNMSYLSARDSFSLLPINHYQLNSRSIQDVRVAQLAKKMAYKRMMEEIDDKKNRKKSTNFLNTSSSSILTESMRVNHLLNDIMIQILNEIYQEQLKQQPRASRQGELLYVKRRYINNDETRIFITKKPHKHNFNFNSPLSNSSSTSSTSSTCSSSVHTKINNKHKSNHNSSHRKKQIIQNSQLIKDIDDKQVRTKRGQYRRYESEQLAKAVAAVLNNQMSVHKAGSYYGVPHSTLEYKVKERATKTPITIKQNKNQLSKSVNESHKYISRSQSMEYESTNNK